MRAAIALALVIALAAPARAQTYGIPVTSGGPIGTMASIPAIPCPTGVGLLGGGWNVCNSIQQWIALYNDGVRLQNELAEIERNVARYATYPQSLASNVQADLGQIEQLIDRASGLAIADTSAAATVARLFPAYQPALPYSDYQTQLAAATQQSVLNALDVAGLDVSTTTRDADLAQVVKDAVARATAPTQATQALAQLTAVLIEQVQKQQRIEAAALDGAAASYLSHANTDAAAAQSDAAAIAAWQRFMDTSVPTLTAAQARALVGAP